jgi:hypothetical protein
MPNSNTARRSTRCLALYDGRRCVGFILARGKAGYEAIDLDKVSQGFFPTQEEAAAALCQLLWSCGSPTRSSLWGCER